MVVDVWLGKKMAFEKRFPNIEPKAFTSNGTINGKLTILDTSVFKVKQKVILSADTLPNITVEIKSITDENTITVGPIGGSISKYIDISLYTVVLNAAISANEQARPSIPIQEIERYVYEEEPTVAKRVMLVDVFGNHISESNPLDVKGELSLQLSNTENPFIYNIEAILQDTEYSQLLPPNTTKFRLRARNNKAKVSISYIENESSTNYLTIIPGNIYEVSNVRLSNQIVYFQTNKQNTVIEIEVWTT